MSDGLQFNTAVWTGYFWQHDGAVVSAVASLQKDPGHRGLFGLTEDKRINNFGQNAVIFCSN